MKFLFGLLILLTPTLVLAAEVDTDGDGLTDVAENSIYYTNSQKADTDGDGFTDQNELTNGFSPHLGFSERLINVDQDHDGLNDGYELALKTDLKNSDSDGDGFSDGDEFKNEYDPTTADPIKLEKSIDINLSTQKLNYYLGPVRLNTYTVSTGKAATPTPVGSWTIEKKSLRAWSSLAGLWMPYWMSFNGVYAIHELPEWPDGTKEGANHLGIPVSHGCVRLGIGPAQTLYDWTPIGTKLTVHY